MIGATPTYYDPDQDSQPQAPNYQHWIDSQAQSQLTYPNTSYPPQPSVSTSRTQRPMQSQAPRHTNHYQFVASHHQPPAPPPPPQSSDTTPYGFFDNQNPTFNTAQRPPGVTSNWTQQPSVGFGQPPPSSEDPYTLLTEQFFPVAVTHPSAQQPQQQYLSPVDHPTPGVPRTPVSDATLQSRQSISPAWTDNQPLPPPGPGLPNAPTGSVIFQQTSPKSGKRTQGKTKQRKRQKSETDTDDDDDVVGSNVGANMPRPNRL